MQVLRRLRSCLQKMDIVLMINAWQCLLRVWRVTWIKIKKKKKNVEVLSYLQGDSSPGEDFFINTHPPLLQFKSIDCCHVYLQDRNSMALLRCLKLPIWQFFAAQLLLVSQSAAYFCVLDYFWLNIEFCICCAVNCDHWSYFAILNVAHAFGNKKSWMKNIFVTLLL